MNESRLHCIPPKLKVTNRQQITRLSAFHMFIKRHTSTFFIFYCVSTFHSSTLWQLDVQFIKKHNLRKIITPVFNLIHYGETFTIIKKASNWDDGSRLLILLLISMYTGSFGGHTHYWDFVYIFVFNKLSYLLYITLKYSVFIFKKMFIN